MSDTSPRGSPNHEGLTYPTWADIATFPLPNYVDPPSRKAAVVVVEVTITVLAAFILALRFYARTVIKNVLGWDDWLMFFAMVCSVVITILHCLATKYAMGLHLWDVRFFWIKPTGILTYASLVFFAPAVSFSKISLSMTHLRILPGRADRIFARCAIAFSIGYCISITFVNIFQCSPIAAYWDVTIPQYRCINERRFNYAAQALNSSSDFLIFLWPARSLWSIRVPLKQRLVLIFVFSIGSVVCVAGIVRLYYLSRYFRTYDYFWTGSIINILHSIELNFAIICGCLPGIKPILSRFFPRTFTGTTTIRGAHHYDEHPQSADKSVSATVAAAAANAHADAAHGHALDPTSKPEHAPSSSRRASDQSMIEVPVKLDPTEFAPTSPSLPSEKAHWSPIAPPPPFQYPKSPSVPVERVYQSHEEYRPPVVDRPSPVRLYHTQTHDPEVGMAPASALPAYQDERERVRRSRHHSDPHPGRRISGI